MKLFAHQRRMLLMAAVAIASLGLARGAWASTAAGIASDIKTNTAGDLNATVSGATVTVTGSVGAAPSTANYLTLNIDAGVTVKWQATLIGTPNSDYALVYISGGTGTFQVENGGTIYNDGTGRAVTNNSACAVNITGGEVKSKSGTAIYNASTGVITISGSTTKITSASSSYGTIYLANSGTESVDRLVINGGMVENTSSGNAIYNNSVGTVRVSNGTVSAISGSAILSNANYMNIGGSYGNYWGSVKISGGTVSTTTGTTISGGEPTVSGGTVSTTTGTAISTGNTSGFTVSGGTVSATTGRAINYNAGGTVTISGSSTKVTSANTSTSYSSGTIYFSDGGTLIINAGTVENTATSVSANGNANAIGIYWSSTTVNVNGGIVKSEVGNAISHVYAWNGITVNISGGMISTNASSKAAVYVKEGTVKITGGTIENTANSWSVYNESSASLTLGGNPTITGRIYTYPEKMSVITAATDKFVPAANRLYTLDFPEAQYVVSKIAVMSGRDFLRNFVLYNSNFALSQEGQHLAVATSVKVTFDLNGGTGVAPATIGVASGGKLYEKPSTNGYTKTCYTSDSVWYTRTGTSDVYTKFVFGESGTSVTENITLYLKWTPGTYKITYNLNDGTNNASNPSSYTCASSTITLQNPTRTGYLFGGWFTNSALTGTAVSSIPAGSTGDKTFYAKWIPIFTVTFDANGGTVTPASGSTRADSTLASLPKPERSGYHFKDWYTAAAGGTVVTASRKYSAHTTIYAQWIPVFTVTFDANGGTVTPTSGTTRADSTLASLPKPERSGYEFSWYTAATGGTVVTESRKYSANTTIYAQWTPIKYTVSFDLNGGSGTAPASIPNVTPGSTLSVAQMPSAGGFTRSGYVNDGKWYTRTGGTALTESFENGTNDWVFVNGSQTNKWMIGTAAKNTGSYSAYISNDNSANSYTISSPSVVHIYKDMTFPASGSDFYLTFYFKGNGESGYDDMTVRYSTTGYTPVAGSIFTSGTSIGTNCVSNSGWTQKSITLPAATFSGKTMRLVFSWRNDGSMGTQPPAAIDDISVTASSSQNTYTEFVFGSGGTAVTANTTLYLQWTPVYAVTWNPDGGAPAPTQTSVNHGGSITAPAPMTKSGDYIFGGWYTNSALTSAATFPVASVTESKSFYAKWIPVFTVTFNANGGTVTPASGATRADSTLASLPIPTRERYAFNGWFTAETGGMEVTEGRKYSANTVIYAHWTQSAYVITFDAKGGTVTPTTMTIGESGRIASLPTPTRTGYDFDGWFTAETGGTAVTTSTVFSVDAAIYARWTPTYAVTFSAGENGVLAVTVDGNAIATGAQVRQGKNVVFTATPNNGYTVGGWSVNGTAVNGNTGNTYTLSSVSAARAVAVSFEKTDAVLVSDRVVPQSKPSEAVTVAPVNRLAAEFTAGPNPADKSSGVVKFFRQGSRIASAPLLVIYDASGNAVKKVGIADKAAACGNDRRAVGSWNLKDAKGRPVPEGTYLVKGVVKTANGKREKVSVAVGVR
jgi:uncharacterized repeat protein (TIGR02543 family)